MVFFFFFFCRRKWIKTNCGVECRPRGVTFQRSRTHRSMAEGERKKQKGEREQEREREWERGREGVNRISFFFLNKERREILRCYRVEKRAGKTDRRGGVSAQSQSCCTSPEPPPKIASFLYFSLSLSPSLRGNYSMSQARVEVTVWVCSSLASPSALLLSLAAAAAAASSGFAPIDSGETRSSD